MRWMRKQSRTGFGANDILYVSESYGHEFNLFLKYKIVNYIFLHVILH